MLEDKKEHGVMDMIKDGLSYITHIISDSLFHPIAEGAELIMKNIEDRILRLERRILRKVSSLIVIGFGAALLVFALLFFMIDYLGWSSAASFFSVGITILVIGLILKVAESDR